MTKTLSGAAVVLAAAGALAAGAGAASASSTAVGGTDCSPGVASGNLLHVPVHVPVNVTGLSANLVGVLNPAFGNHSANNG
jgi:hypothetical protein